MYKEDFSKRLKQARKNAKMHQEDVRNVTGIKETTLSHYETGRRQPDIESLVKLIDLYKIDANWLLGTGEYNNRTFYG